MPAAPAKATYTATYYTQPGYAPQVTSYLQSVNGSYDGIPRDLSLNLGGSAADASNAATIAKRNWLARLAAKAVPPLSVAATRFNVAVTGLTIGWMIGRYADTKWLHLSSTEIQGYTGGAVTSMAIQWTSIGSSLMWVLAVDIGAPVNGMSTAPYDCASVTGISPCIEAWRVDAATAVRSSAGGQLLVNTNDCVNGVCRIYRKLASNDIELAQLMEVETFKDWSGETPTVTTTGWTPTYGAQGFASQAAQNAAFTDAIGADESDAPGQNLDNVVNASGTVPDPLVDFSMPDCVGLSVSSCEAAIDADAADAHVSVSYNVVTASVNDANLSIDADLIISTSPGSGTTGWPWPTTITITKNPDPLPIIWPLPNWDETYSQYLLRLQQTGWVGAATVVTLDDANGESDFVLSGVPCTSVLGGTRIAGDAAVTFYRNPTSFASSDPVSGPYCGMGDVTGFNMDICSIQGSPPWQSLVSGENASFYLAECADAWTYLRSLEVFNADGTMDATVFANSRVFKIGTELTDEELKHYFSQQGVQMAHIQKRSTETFVTTNDRAFQVHYYWNTDTERVDYNRGFKIKFNQQFEP